MDNEKKRGKWSCFLQGLATSKEVCISEMRIRNEKDKDFTFLEESSPKHNYKRARNEMMMVKK